MKLFGWIKNTDGKEDAALTVAIWVTALVVAKSLVGGFVVIVGGFVLSVAAMDAGAAAALLSATWGAYLGRRATDAVIGKAAAVVPAAPAPAPPATPLPLPPPPSGSAR